MNATIVDLRYKMKEVLRALNQKESVQVFYHGKPTAVILPVTEMKKPIPVKNHPFFKMNVSKETVEQTMTRLRGGRYLDL